MDKGEVMTHPQKGDEALVDVAKTFDHMNLQRSA
jgi:hypothetical protein